MKKFGANVSCCKLIVPKIQVCPSWWRIYSCTFINIFFSLGFFFQVAKKDFVLLNVSNIAFLLRLYKLLEDKKTPVDTLKNFWKPEIPLEFSRSADCIFLLVRETVNRFIKESQRNPGNFPFYEKVEEFFFWCDYVEGRFVLAISIRVFWMFVRILEKSMFM